MKIRFLSVLCILLMSCSPMAKTPQAKSTEVSRDIPSGVQDCPFEFSKVMYCAQLGRLNKQYVVGKPMSFKLGFWEKDVGTFAGPYVDPGLEVHTWLWMKMETMSHGAAAITVNKSSIDGIYDLTNLVFSMPPRNERQWWELHVQLKKADGTVVDEAVQAIWDSSGD